MDDKVRAYLEKAEQRESERKAAELKKQQDEMLRKKQDLLEKLGLYESVKEYAPDGVDDLDARFKYPNWGTVDGVTRRYRMNKVYPEITDEEYQQLINVSGLNALKPRPESAENARSEAAAPLQVKAAFAESECFSSKCMRVCAFICWIGGIIASILTSRVQVITSSGLESEFSWTMFFASIIVYAVAGLICFILSEVFGDIHIIATSVKEYRVNTSEAKKHY